MDSKKHFLTEMNYMLHYLFRLLNKKNIYNDDIEFLIL
jgi:hypothetical protein